MQIPIFFILQIFTLLWYWITMNWNGWNATDNFFFAARVNKLQIHYIFPHCICWCHILSQRKQCLFFSRIQRACIKISYHLSKFSSPLTLARLFFHTLNVVYVGRDWGSGEKIRQIFIWPSGNGHFPEKLSSISTHGFFLYVGFWSFIVLTGSLKCGWLYPRHLYSRATLQCSQFHFPMFFLSVLPFIGC